MFTLMGAWWHRTFDYDAMPTYMGQRGLLGQYRKLLLLIVVMLVFAGVLLMVTVDAGKDRASILIPVVGGGVSALVWLHKPWPTRRMSLAFIFGNDIGLLAALIILNDPKASFTLSIVFALLAVYCGYFHSVRTLMLHALLTMLAAVFFFITALRAGTDDPIFLAAQLIIQFALFVLSPLLAQVPLSFLRDDAYISSTDPLTGALNRRGLTNTVHDSLFTRVAPTDVVALMVVDLDRFKSVNDILGHAGGDTVLEKVSARLMRESSGWAHVARLGGEEFCVIGVVPSDGMCLLFSAVHAVVCDESDPMSVTASAGVAWVPSARWRRDPDLVDVLLRRADRVMYDAKRAGGDRVWFDDNVWVDGDIRIR